MLGQLSDDYHYLNSSAHRKETIRFSAPALTYHIASWIDCNNDVVQTELRFKSKCALNEFIFRVYSLLRSDNAMFSSVNIFPSMKDRVILMENGYYISPAYPYLMPIDKSSLSVSEQQILATDYRTIYVAFEWRGFKYKLKFELSTEYYSFTAVASATEDAYNGETARRYDELRRLLDASEDSQQLVASNIREYFFSTFWAEFQENVTPPSLVRELECQLFTNIFADFRGVVMSEHTKFFALDNVAGTASPRWGHHAANCLMPFINDKVAKHECTASYLLDGRALYMTTLGPQPQIDKEGQHIPVKYLCYVRQTISPDDVIFTVVNKWELGKLIATIHILGTLRLAAIRRLEKLHASGQILGRLEPLIKSARELITEDEKERDAIKYIRRANLTFNSINKEDISILYRIERSRLYALQYRNIIPTLGLRRLDGFQKYDDFVYRRLGATFDFIDRLGRRYDRATNNLGLLDQYYLTITANNISRLGEAILFVVLVPYYATSLLVHLRGEEFGIYGYFILAISGTWGFVKYWEILDDLTNVLSEHSSPDTKESKKESRKNLFRFSRWIFIFYLIILGLYYLPSPHNESKVQFYDTNAQPL